jgi:hypothetical protein
MKDQIIRSAIISTFRHGRHTRICERCMLVVNTLGGPDETFYSPEELARFRAIPFEERCRHQREAKA